MKITKTFVIIFSAMFLIFLSFYVKASDKNENCVSEESSGRVTMQCKDGTVSVTTSDKLVVCSKGLNGSMNCEQINLKDNK